mmetsp:Transcript_14534/g.39888  ORF Transcript_14534/g.39888 Transcript_14534/m.39888 type:complete len:105 (+) Transcript_14534:111-425(+)
MEPLANTRSNMALSREPLISRRGTCPAASNLASEKRPSRHRGSFDLVTGPRPTCLHVGLLVSRALVRLGGVHVTEVAEPHLMAVSCTSFKHARPTVLRHLVEVK